MKKTYCTPKLKIVESRPTQTLMNSMDQRGWTKDGNYQTVGDLYEQEMGGGHGVSFNLRQQEENDYGWVDID